MTNVFPPFEPDRTGPRLKGKLAAGLRHGQVPVRVLIPNFITLIGLAVGLTAIRMGIEQRFDLAIAAVVFAALLDGVDGRVARLLKASSRFGAELDSLADFVNFGVAPAIIVFTWALSDLKSLGWIVVMIFALCAALRLARFNAALASDDQPKWKGRFFVGVPAPAGAIIVMLPIYLDGLGLPDIPGTTQAILAYTLLIAVLMVSRVPTFSGKSAGRISRDWVLPLFLFLMAFFASLLTYPFLTLTVGTLTYLCCIPVSMLAYRRLDEAEAKERRSKNGRSERPAASKAGTHAPPPPP